MQCCTSEPELNNVLINVRTPIKKYVYNVENRTLSASGSCYLLYMRMK